MSRFETLFIAVCLGISLWHGPGIIGDYLRDRPDPGDPGRVYLAEIGWAGDRGYCLFRQRDKGWIVDAKRKSDSRWVCEFPKALGATPERGGENR